MATGAVIGALRVNLGLDSAQFSAGLKKAQSGLDGFGKVAAAGFAAASVAAVAAGTALAVMGKKAIDAADNMSKTAQRVGVTTEALSRLKYAADYSDVSLEQLSGGLQKLTKNLADVASGSGRTAQIALQALGISATDANGVLRSSDEVFADIADRFARMENGATKTALAVQLFGRSGADLIPLLNSGRAGLKAMADESDRLGLTVSTKTGLAAEQFNDTITKVQKTLEGLVQRVSLAALPALQGLADKLASPEFQQAAEQFGTAMVEQLSKIIELVAEAQGKWEAFVDWMNRGGRPKVYRVGSQNIEDRSEPGWLDQQRKAGRVVSGSFDALGGGNMFGSVEDMWKALTPPKLPTFGNSGVGDGVGEALAGRLDALRESLMTEEELERNSFAKRLEEIQKFYDNGMLKRGEYDDLVERAQAEHSDRMAELVRAEEEEKARIRDMAISGVAGIFGSLSKLAESFGEKNLATAKAFGVAEAVVNTAQGITQALTLPFPASWAQAAAVAASGAAQIATILSASPGSTTKPNVSTSAPAVTAPEQGGGGISKAVNITFQGLGRSGMEQFVRELQDAIGDGVKLTLNPA